MRESQTTSWNNVEPIYVETKKNKDLRLPVWIIAIVLSVYCLVNSIGIIVFYASK